MRLTPSRRVLAASAALSVAALTGAAIATAGAATAANDDPTVLTLHKSGASSLELTSVGTMSATTPDGNLRLSGNDRYETAAAISSATWEYEDTSIVFLASGTSTADALGMGASTMLAGPILLTRKDELPDATRSELARLRPCTVVVVGGTGVVSDAVLHDAEQYVDRSECTSSEY